jgi:phenylacetic acid degradation operon negative regulatory protein
MGRFISSLRSATPCDRAVSAYHLRIDRARNEHDQEGMTVNGFAYEEIMYCLRVLGQGAYGPQIAGFIELFLGLADAMDVKGMLRRLVHRGKLMRDGQGAQARYRLPSSDGRDDAVRMKSEQAARPWDGTWHVLSYDVPEANRNPRRRLRLRLRELGFGMLNASSWISPYDWETVLRSAITRMNCPGSFAYLQSDRLAELTGADPSYPVTVWNLGELAERYGEVGRACAAAPRTAGEDAIRARARIALWVARSLAGIERDDPMLPAVLLPVDWPRDAVLREFSDLAGRVRADVEEHPPERADSAPGRT